MMMSMNPFLWLILTIINIYFWIILAQVVLSWLVAFNVVNRSNPFVRQVGTALERLTADAANGDRVFAAERTVYLMCEQSIRKSKAAARIARLFPAATARNGKTARQVYALLRETEF